MSTGLVIMTINQLISETKKTKGLKDRKKQRYLRDLEKLKLEYEKIEVPEYFSKQYNQLNGKGKELIKDMKMGRNIQDIENTIPIYIRYLKASLRQNDGSTSKVTFGKLLENVKVLAVRDSNGKNVFANVDENSVPSQLIFAVPQEYYLLLKKAEYLRSFNTELLPVPTAESLKSNPGDLKLTSDSLKQFINDNTVYAQ